MFFLLMSCLSAQSFFSMRGFGEELMTSDAASAGMGGLVIFSPRNPAYPIALNQTTLTASGLALADIGTDSNGSRLIGNGRPDFFQARLPLPASFRLGLGFAEWYNQDFGVYSESLADYRRSVAGLGGIYGLNASLGRSFGDYATIAVEYSRLLGTSTESWQMDVYNGNYVTLDSVEYNYSGDAVCLGAAGRLPSFRLWKQGPTAISLGGFYEKVLDFQIDSRTRTHQSTSESLGVPVAFPGRYGLGLTVSPVPDLKFSLEGIRQNASQITINDSTTGYFRDMQSIVLGGEYRLDEYHPLRLGLRLQNWYLAAAGNQPIKEVAITTGSAVPIMGFGSLDFSLEYARRTSAALQENVLRSQVTLYFEEPWKKRTRNWGY
jgi:hypothetical protein